MSWYPFVAFFFGGFFLTNAVPHFVSGLLGRPFQSPFASPPGRGLSSPTVNVLWGAFNLAVGYVLLGPVGAFDLRNPLQVGVFGAAVVIRAVLAARRHGSFNGNNAPTA